MNLIALIFFLLCTLAVIVVPRKWAPAALLVGCTYIPLSQGVEVASISLPIYRMLLIVGVFRVIAKGERLQGGINLIDKLLVAWSCWTIFASLFHDSDQYGFITACGSVFNLTLIYFLTRIWTSDLNQIRDVVAVVAFLLVPIAIEMLIEKATGRNLFAVFGGVSEMVGVREGKLRAQGPFLHAILAGTVGAACVPLFVGIFSVSRLVALVGVSAGIFITFASASSGPVVTLMAGLGAVMLWHFKQHMGRFRIAAVMTYLVLMVVMSRPPYFLIGEIDLSGGSTGWHRAELIDCALGHLSEWWLFGTDHTKQWMPLMGGSTDPNHTDITNYYIGMGVNAGLLSVLLVFAALAIAFHWVGRVVTLTLDSDSRLAFTIWCFGSSLFAHLVTGISVSYFDQSLVYYWLTVAVISSSYSVIGMEPTLITQVENESDESHVYSVKLSEREMISLANAEWRRAYRERCSLKSEAPLFGTKEATSPSRPS